MQIGVAHETDIQAVVDLNNRFAPQGLTLPRSPNFASSASN